MQIWSNQQPTSQIQDSLYPNLHFLDAATTLYTEYINKGYDQQLVDKRVYKFLRRERDTLTIKPTAIRYRYQKQRLQARKQPPQVDPKQ